MQKESVTTFNSTFEEDVYQGLTDFPKHLSSKYFYDENGDKLFQDIMQLPEYYLTDAELDILKRHKERIAGYFSAENEAFNLIEMGAGDGTKTKILLKHLQEIRAQFQYLPIDISSSVLEELTKRLKTDFPGIDVTPMQGTYFDSLEEICKFQEQKKVILFLGSNIGNLLHPQAIDFLVQVQQLMKEDDLFFVGFDQKKDPQRILDAYNDPTGVTEAFNKNVLLRINRELEGEFDSDKFMHWESYDPETGTAKSFLVAKEAHQVRINTLDLTVSFDRWETIHTEISQKYDDKVIAWLAEKSGLRIVDQFSDTQHLFKNYLFKKSHESHLE